MRVFLGLLCLLITGCSDDDKPNKLPDAPPLPDAPMPDAPTTGVVSLTITNGTMPVADVRVVFQNADHSIVSETMTNESGVAMATMGVGGFVTAVDPFQFQLGISSVDLRTFAGVKPGDQLRLHENNRGISMFANVNLVLPVDNAASTYSMWLGCLPYPLDVTNPGGSGSPGPGGPISIEACAASTDILIETMDSTGTPLNSLYRANVPLVDSTVDLSAEPYQAATDATFSYSNVPAAAGSVEVDNRLLTAAGPLVNTFRSIGMTGGAGSVTVKRSTVPSPLSVTASRIDGNLTRHHVVDWGTASATYELDVGNLLLAELETRPIVDPAAHAITWTVNASGAAADLARARSFFMRDKSLFWSWEVVGPVDGSSVVFPVLPGTLAPYNPLATDQMDVEQLVVGKVPGGYDAIRAHALAIGIDNLDEEASSVAITGAGRAVFQRMFLAKAAASPRSKRFQRPQPSRIAR